MTSRRIVLDANILIPAMLGVKVGELLTKYAESIDFCAPLIAFEDAEANLPGIFTKPGIGPAELSLGLDAVRHLVEDILDDVTNPMQAEATAADRSPRPRRLADRRRRARLELPDLD